MGMGTIGLGVGVALSLQAAITLAQNGGLLQFIKQGSI